ncbi:hypothetical protein KKC94_01405 [Patescibacteria group bacterium]|nr:hypothetical protein [Patescibacteria group bacterium]
MNKEALIAATLLTGACASEREFKNIGRELNQGVTVDACMDRVASGGLAFDARGDATHMLSDTEYVYQGELGSIWKVKDMTRELVYLSALETLGGNGAYTQPRYADTYQQYDEYEFGNSDIQKARNEFLVVADYSDQGGIGTVNMVAVDPDCRMAESPIYNCDVTGDNDNQVTCSEAQPK